MKVTLADRFKVAGKEATRLNFGNAIKSFGLPDYELYNESFFNQSLPLGSTWRPNGLGNDNPIVSMLIEGQQNPQWGKRSALTAFQLCAPVSAILMQKAQAFINGETYVMGTDGKESTSATATKIKALLNNPNPYQGGDHFEMQVYINTFVFGYTIILPVKPVGFDGTYATQLWAIPGSMVEIELNEDVALFKKDAKPFKRVVIAYGAERTDITDTEFLLIKDSTPSFCTMALPGSRLDLLQKAIQNVIGAMESRGVLITNRGPRYVVSNAASDSYGTKPLLPDEKDEVLQSFKDTYGLLRSQSQAIITNAAVNVNAIGYDVRQLGLMEEVQESSSMICIGLGFPKFLAGLSDPTFNNQDTAEKALYQRFIMPEAKSFYGQLNAFFNTEKYGLKIIKDYSVLPVLQEDKTNMGRARFYMNQACQIEWLNNIITANQWLEANGLDTKPGWDIYYHDWVNAGMNFGSKPGGTLDTGTTTTDNPNAGAPQ